MTRQKKELHKEIERLRLEIAADEALSCGCAPTGAYDFMYERVYELEEQLAKLRRCGSAEEMYTDDRQLRASADADELPFA
ncbi:MAG: hypothetical protein J1F64_05850 [Oscillospiraceae bacterium]|nr:hypothetical protein [Oscillospiraceae bacterium]